MAVPVRPSQFLALVVQPEDSLATAIIKHVKLIVLWYKLNKYLFNSDGSWSQAFRADLCNIKCPTVPATITTP